MQFMQIMKLMQLMQCIPFLHTSNVIRTFHTGDTLHSISNKECRESFSDLAIMEIILILNFLLL